MPGAGHRGKWNERHLTLLNYTKHETIELKKKKKKMKKKKGRKKWGMSFSICCCCCRRRASSFYGGDFRFRFGCWRFNHRKSMAQQLSNKADKIITRPGLKNPQASGRESFNQLFTSKSSSCECQLWSKIESGRAPSIQRILNWKAKTKPASVEGSWLRERHRIVRGSFKNCSRIAQEVDRTELLETIVNWSRSRMITEGSITSITSILLIVSSSNVSCRMSWESCRNVLKPPSPPPSPPPLGPRISKNHQRFD